MVLSNSPDLGSNPLLCRQIVFAFVGTQLAVLSLSCACLEILVCSKKEQIMVVSCQNQNAKMAKGKIYFMRVHVLAIN